MAKPRFWIGTSGWHYDHWRGDFYPRDLPKARWFEHYARHFPTVELNNSFYHQPKDSAWDHWREEAPSGFLFAVKANRFITHIKRLRDPADALDRFIAGARRLDGHLGPLLYQLPPNFEPDVENRRRLAEFLRALPPGYRHAVEFRNKGWFDEETVATLRRHGVAFCAYSMPEMECPLVASAPFVYFRFHGSGRRYGGNYTDGMLRDWAERLQDCATGASEAFVYFNNDIGGHAVRNARRLAELLSDRVSVMSPTS